jgi:hypothetical protein
LERSSVQFQFFFALGHRRFAHREEEIKQRNGPIFQSVLSSLGQNHITTNDVLGRDLDFSHLSAQAFRKIFEPSRHIHPALAHVLERLVISGPVAVVILAYREEALEIVARPIEAQSREQARRTSIASTQFAETATEWSK